MHTGLREPIVSSSITFNKSINYSDNKLLFVNKTLIDKSIVSQIYVLLQKESTRFRILTRFKTKLTFHFYNQLCAYIKEYDLNYRHFYFIYKNKLIKIINGTALVNRIIRHQINTSSTWFTKLLNAIETQDQLDVVDKYSVQENNYHWNINTAAVIYIITYNLHFPLLIYFDCFIPDLLGVIVECQPYCLNTCLNEYKDLELLGNLKNCSISILTEDYSQFNTTLYDLVNFWNADYYHIIQSGTLFHRFIKIIQTMYYYFYRVENEERAVSNGDDTLLYESLYTTHDSELSVPNKKIFLSEYTVCAAPHDGKDEVSSILGDRLNSATTTADLIQESIKQTTGVSGISMIRELLDQSETNHRLLQVLATEAVEREQFNDFSRISKVLEIVEWSIDSAKDWLDKTSPSKLSIDNSVNSFFPVHTDKLNDTLNQKKNTQGALTPIAIPTPKHHRKRRSSSNRHSAQQSQRLSQSNSIRSVTSPVITTEIIDDQHIQTMIPKDQDSSQKNTNNIFAAFEDIGNSKKQTPTNHRQKQIESKNTDKTDDIFNFFSFPSWAADFTQTLPNESGLQTPLTPSQLSSQLASVQTEPLSIDISVPTTNVTNNRNITNNTVYPVPEHLPTQINHPQLLMKNNDKAFKEKLSSPSPTTYTSGKNEHVRFVEVSPLDTTSPFSASSSLPHQTFQFYPESHDSVQSQSIQQQQQSKKDEQDIKDKWELGSQIQDLENEMKLTQQKTDELKKDLLDKTNEIKQLKLNLETQNKEATRLRFDLQDQEIHIRHAKDMWMKESTRASVASENIDDLERRLFEKEQQFLLLAKKYEKVSRETSALKRLVIKEVEDFNTFPCYDSMNKQRQLSSGIDQNSEILESLLYPEAVFQCRSFDDKVKSPKKMTNQDNVSLFDKPFTNPSVKQKPTEETSVVLRQMPSLHSSNKETQSSSYLLSNTFAKYKDDSGFHYFSWESDLNTTIQHHEQLLFTNEERINFERFRHLFLHNDAILFETAAFQVGIKANYRGLTGTLQLYFGNCTHGEFQCFSVTLHVPPELDHAIGVTQSIIPSTLGAKQQICQSVVITCLEPFETYPTLRIRFLLPDTSPELLQFPLPLPITKFMEEKFLSYNEFFKFWKHEEFVLREVTAIIALDYARFHRSLLVIARTIQCSGALSLLPGIDTDEDNLVFSGIFPATTTSLEIPTSLVLVRYETGRGRYRDVCRLSIRSDSFVLSRAIRSILILLLSEPLRSSIPK